MFRLKWKYDCVRINKIQFRLHHKWIKPVGTDTKIKVYDEREKAKVPLIFPNKNYVKWYMCGPTVYETSHVGHASCYVKLDIIHRILKEFYQIHPVVAIGITDVSEVIVNKSKLLKKRTHEITNKYSDEFFEYMNQLNVLPPVFKLKVSYHIKEIIQFIDLLIRRRVAYIGADGSVYFSVEADPKYGIFKGCPSVELESWESGKKDPRDFALWKASKDGYINSPWGRGIPGWHIECSAMASSVFGSTIDIHSGGSDLIFPHHENEEAQSRHYHRCDQWVNYWLHSGMLTVGNVKMSKSLGNFHSIKDFLEYYRSDHLRMFCLMSSYRSVLNFDDQTIQLAMHTLEKIGNFLDMAESYIGGTLKTGNINESGLLEELENTKKMVKKHLADDFGTPEALKAVMLLIKTCSKMLREECKDISGRSPSVVALIKLYVKEFFQSLGFEFMTAAERKESNSAINTVITHAVDARANVRNFSLSLSHKYTKDEILKLCDEFREKLASCGVEVLDFSSSHSEWKFNASVQSKTLLKDVVDNLVWFRAQILKLAAHDSIHKYAGELCDIGTHIKVFLGTLGVEIRDNTMREVDWAFPNSITENKRILEGIVMLTLQFQNQVRETAKDLPQEKTKEELVCLCETFISDLDELGVKVNEKQKIFEMREETGTFFLNNLLHTITHFRDQALVIANTTNDPNVKNELFRICGFARKSLTSHGVLITESSSSITSTWRMKFDLANSEIHIYLIDIAVSLLCATVKLSKNANNKLDRFLILEICDSTIADLRLAGVTVKNLGRKMVTWHFDPKVNVGYSFLCLPEVKLEGGESTTCEAKHGEVLQPDRIERVALYTRFKSH